MKLKLTRFLSDGAILQKNEAIPVRGWADPGQEILAVLFRQGKETTEPAAERVQEKSTRAAEDGSFFLQLDPLPAGGPYELRVSAENGETLRIPNLLIGAVFYVSGQSNIDVDMERCRDSYPEIWGDCADDGLRTFRITENADYHGPLSEPLTGEWKTAGPGTIGAFSATGYFFARALREMTGMPVGFIQASLGGSRITLTLEEVSSVASLSPTYFSKKFKLITGMGFKEYLNYVRLKHAQTALLTTGSSITDIALEYGFNDSNYFKDLFKKVYGKSPREYRKNPD